MMRLVTLLAIFMMISTAGHTMKSHKNESPSGNEFFSEGKTIQVYYFHYTRRCATCNAVEDETKRALNEYFKKQIDEGEITFMSVNLEEEANSTLIDLYQVSGQSLILVCDDEKIDLTDKAFLNALTKPEKLRKLVKESVEKLAE